MMKPARASGQAPMDTVWRQRAARLSKRPMASGIGPDSFQVMVLAIGNERYGVELADVAEALPPVRSTPVPGAPPLFLGVVNIHGEIRAVVDLNRLLGGAAAESGAAARMILLRREDREIVLAVDRVEQVRWISPQDMQASSGGGFVSPYLQGLTKDMLMLLSTKALFAELSKGTTS